MTRKSNRIGSVAWYCVAAVTWGAMVFLLIAQSSVWPRCRRSLVLIYQEAVGNPEWNHTIQGDPLSLARKEFSCRR
jgi:hypothetical protein